MPIYLNYRSIPELAPLEPLERERALRVSGIAFGRTRTFWVVHWLGLLMVFGLSAATWFAVRPWSETGLVAMWSALAVALAGYTLWFHFRMHYQRPYIRRCLETGAHHDGEAVQRAATAARVESGWRFVVTRGLAWGVLTTAIVAVTSGLQAPWYVVLPLACVGGLVWSTFMLWMRKRLT